MRKTQIARTHLPRVGRCVPTVAAFIAATMIPCSMAYAVEYDLTTNAPAFVDGDVGGVAIFDNFFEQPAGTGVFDPFLTVEREARGGNPSNLEHGYNTDGHTNLFLDQQRPEWNTLLKVGDLAQIDINGILYYGFILDANEPGQNKSLISIDNIRIYTSPTDNTASVGNNLSNFSNLGTLRWAMNNPLLSGGAEFDGFDVDQWVKLDADQDNVDFSNSNGGSGKADMVLYVPVSDFAGASDTDFLTFYNLNGVHYSVNSDLGAEAGFEEWRAITGPRQNVPDGGATIGLLGLSCSLMLLASRKQKRSEVA